MAIKQIAGLFLLGISSLALAQSAPKAKYGPWGVDYTSMDKAVTPGDDFFRYAEGTWLKTAPIAPAIHRCWAAAGAMAPGQRIATAMASAPRGRKA